MDLSTGPRLHHLDQAVPGRSVLKIERARGARVACVAGVVWITEDGRQDDVVLSAGESAMLELAGLAMITPFGSAEVEIACADGAPATASAGAFEWLRARLRPADRHACCA